MSLAVLVALAGVAGAVTLFARLRTALVALIAVTFLVPGTVIVPFVGSTFLSIHRVALLGILVNLAFRIRERDVPLDVLRPLPMHGALAAYVAVSFVVGVVANGSDVSISSSIFLWLFIVDQLVFFVVVLAVIRAIGDTRWIVRMIVVLAVIAAAIAVGERLIGSSYAQKFFTNLRGLPGGGPLDTRGGEFRVRSAAPFSVAYAWIGLALLPLVLSIASRLRITFALAIAGLMSLSIVWTVARSAYLGFAVVTVAMLLLSRFDRRITMVILVGGVLGALGVGATNALEQSFGAREAVGSTEVREVRLPAVLGEAAERPLLGVGFAGLAARGLPTIDSSFLLLYAETGVVGVSALGLVLVMAFRTILPALRAPPGEDRVVGAASTAGVLAVIVGALFHDTLSISWAWRTLWLMVALGASVSERYGRAVEPEAKHRFALRASIPAVGALVGLVVAVSAPTFHATKFRFRTLGPRIEAESTAPFVFAGNALINTTCSFVDAAVLADPATTGDCYRVTQANGIGEVRIQAPARPQLQSRVRVVFNTGRRFVPGFGVFVVDQARRARPTWARTAPVWMAAAGLAIALVLPLSRRRRDAT